MRLAAGKDRGFSSDSFAEALGGIDRFGRHDFPIDDALYSELRDEFAEWRQSIAVERSPEPETESRRAQRERPGLDL